MDIKGTSSIILGIMIISIIGGVWWKFNSLQSNLALTKPKLETAKQTIITKTGIIANRDQSISQQQDNIASLTKTIDEHNKYILKSNKQLSLAKQKLIDWKKKPKKTKFIYKYIVDPNVDYSKGNCIDGKKLNKRIGGLNYEDL